MSHHPTPTNTHGLLSTHRKLSQARKTGGKRMLSVAFYEHPVTGTQAPRARRNTQYNGADSPTRRHGVRDRPTYSPTTAQTQAHGKPRFRDTEPGALEDSDPGARDPSQGSPTAAQLTVLGELPGGGTRTRDRAETREPPESRRG